MSDIVSRPYPKDLTRACERCVFGTGEHAEWCLKIWRPVSLAQLFELEFSGAD
jgi:hypothetical protein